MYTSYGLTIYLAITTLTTGYVLPSRSLCKASSFQIQKSTGLALTLPAAALQPILSLQAFRSDPWYVWSLLTMTSTLGVAAEKSGIGSMLSSPLVTMATSLVLCNTGLLPSTHAVYSLIMKYLVPLAVPLLLLDADLFRCFRLMKALLKAFLVGSMGTVFGTFVAFYFVPMKRIDGAYKVAAALCSRHIGGAVNFIAISEILKIPAEVITATIAADNVVVALYFALLFVISVPEKEDKKFAGFSKPAVQVKQAAKCPFPLFSATSSSTPSEPGAAANSVTEQIQADTTVATAVTRYRNAHVQHFCVVV